jgi:hypothetical protein
MCRVTRDTSPVVIPQRGKLRYQQAKNDGVNFAARSLNLSTSQSLNLSISQSLNLSISQSLNLSISQSLNLLNSAALRSLKSIAAAEPSCI